ncbi:MAG: carboxypeptidase-like regulatory domain-containing protein, partial [bacterium]
ISGNVNSGTVFFQNSAEEKNLLTTFSQLLISSAHAAGVAGVEVQLLLDGAVVDSQVTDGSGNFLFSSLPAGSYSLRLMMDGANLGESPAIALDPNTKTELDLNLDGTVTNMKVEAENEQISGNISDGDDSSDMQGDHDSEDDVSVDDDSSDDDSDDDDSSDDDSSDDDTDDADSSGGIVE